MSANQKDRHMKWNRLDNAATIFPPTSHGADTGVFRLSCELKEQVQPERLQLALEQTLADFPHMKSSLRRGVFWYYLEQTNRKFQVVPEENPPCARLYRGSRSPLFSVSYWRHKINLDIFHVLADGVGAISFFQALITQYLELVNYARSVMPGLVITSDIIIGFPGETEEEAMETVSLVDEVGYDALFTFIYSPRPGTKAAQMPDPVSRAEKQKWFDKLLEVQNARSAALHAAYVGKTVRAVRRRERRCGLSHCRPDRRQPPGAAQGRCVAHRALCGRSDYQEQYLGPVRGAGVRKAPLQRRTARGMMEMGRHLPPRYKEVSEHEYANTIIRAPSGAGEGRDAAGERRLPGGARQ